MADQPKPRAVCIVGATSAMAEHTARLLAARGDSLALVEDMVAGGHHVGAGVDRLAEYLLGDAETAGRVLAIDDDEVEPEV